MSDRSTKGKTVAISKPAQTYEVGYGKPPVATRFKPGQSGNSHGRPKGTQNASQPRLNDERLKSIILDEAYRTITVNDANGPVTISMAQAVVRSLAVNAAKGNQRAQRLFTQLLSTVERDNMELHSQWLETAINYKIEWERELDRRKRLGIKAPDPLPHPDHVIIDMHAGTVHITGPMTSEEKVVWDLVQQGGPGSEEQLAELEKIVAARPGMAIAERLGLPRATPVEVSRIERVIKNPKEFPGTDEDK